MEIDISPATNVFVISSGRSSSLTSSSSRFTALVWWSITNVAEHIWLALLPLVQFVGLIASFELNCNVCSQIGQTRQLDRVENWSSKINEIQWCSIGDSVRRVVNIRFSAVFLSLYISDLSRRMSKMYSTEFFPAYVSNKILIHYQAYREHNLTKRTLILRSYLRKNRWYEELVRNVGWKVDPICSLHKQVLFHIVMIFEYHENWQMIRSEVD